MASDTITNITLKDYQIWGGLDIELSPFTVIVGPSGYGKSSILRALHGIFTCPTGTSHIRHGTKQSVISITTPEETITWMKSKRTNLYRIDHDTVEQTRLFDKVGRDVPEEILKILDLPAVELDGKQYALYYDGQFDQPFLIFESPQQAARILMAVTGVERLTGVQKQVASDRRGVQAEMKAVADEVTRIETDPRLVTRIKGCLGYQSLNEQIAEYKAANHMLDAMVEVKSRQQEEPGDRLELDISEYGNIVDSLAVLPDKVELPGDSLELEISEYQLVLQLFDQLPDKVELPDQPIEHQHLEKYNEKFEKWEQLNRLQTLLADVKYGITCEREYLKEIEKEYAEVMVGTCPLCEGALE